MQQGLGLIVVDVVISRKANLHDALLAAVGDEGEDWGAELYTAAYRPVNHDGEMALDIWQQPLAVGDSLPNLPLWLRGGPCLAVDLQVTYQRTTQAHRLGEV